MNEHEPAPARSTILVIIGITGDLATRKLLPAIAQIAAAGQLPAQFKVIGVTRRALPAEELLEQVQWSTLRPISGHSKSDASSESESPESLQASARSQLAGMLELFQMNLDEPADYVRLREHIAGVQAGFSTPLSQAGNQQDTIKPTDGKSGLTPADTDPGTPLTQNHTPAVVPQTLFYLSVPPGISRPIVRRLGEAGFASDVCALLLEKPFGTDLTSASELSASLHKHFAEEQIYRIDHYLAKEMAQNLVVFRSSNSLFKNTWNRDFIERIEVIASERIGIEGRATFYEQTGALRDVVQSHLLQLAALALMPLPTQSDWRDVPAQRLQALQSLELPALSLPSAVVRGQYDGYQTEVKNPGSTVETFVSLTLESHDPAWRGVPITLTTGKALDRKTTEIRLTYRQEQATEASELVLRVQPNESIEIALWSKQPGYGRKLEKTMLKFSYDLANGELPDAYERVLLDAVRGDRTLFTSDEEVLASWRILEPVLHAWSMDSRDLKHYPAGSTPQNIIES